MIGVGKRETKQPENVSILATSQVQTTISYSKIFETPLHHSDFYLNFKKLFLSLEAKLHWLAENMLNK